MNNEGTLLAVKISAGSLAMALCAFFVWQIYIASGLPPVATLTPTSTATATSVAVQSSQVTSTQSATPSPAIMINPSSTLIGNGSSTHFISFCSGFPYGEEQANINSGIAEVEAHTGVKNLKLFQLNYNCNVGKKDDINYSYLFYTTSTNALYSLEKNIVPAASDKIETYIYNYNPGEQCLIASQWNVSSQQVVNNFMDQGGSQLLASIIKNAEIPSLSLTLTCSPSVQTQWTVILFPLDATSSTPSMGRSYPAVSQ